MRLKLILQFRFVAEEGWLGFGIQIPCGDYCFEGTGVMMFENDDDGRMVREVRRGVANGVAGVILNLVVATDTNDEWDGDTVGICC